MWSSQLISKFLVALFLFSSTYAAKDTICPFKNIYQFGDSIADTGNILVKAPNSPSSRLPYGETYFHKPTGRLSNGLLMIDFITKALGLPLLEPYLKKDALVDHGVNFAVAGSTALDTSYFTARNVTVPASNTPLSMQLKWFEDHLNSVCQNRSECVKRLGRSLIMMGEIGANDYNHALIHDKPIEEVRTYVKDVVGAIVDAIRHIVHLGAIRIVVPGDVPLGCIPVYLTKFANVDPKAYDNMGCLKEWNEFAEYHNKHLRKALATLREELKLEFPNVVILYADYYNAFQSVLHRAPFLGIHRSTLLKACCGTGGPYNYDSHRTCGDSGVPVCTNPSHYMHWDGLHLTQKGDHHMSEVLIPDILSKIQCTW